MRRRLSIVFLFIHLWLSVRSVPIQKFYPFGIENGDSQLSKNEHETSSPEILLKVPIKFYSDIYSSLYINSNGLISFITPLPTFANVLFPLDYPAIAALYANVDIRSNGVIFYREINSSTLLHRITREIKQFFPNSGANFQASGLFIATWYKVGYFNRKSDKVNTFQVVIASNQNDTYIQFLYANDGIQWLHGEGQPATGLIDAKAQAGLVAADGRFYALPGSGTDQIKSLTRLSNTNEAGVWIFKTGPFDNKSNVEVPNTAQIPSEQITFGDHVASCAIGFSLCHSQATCIDTTNGYCCTCRPGFYGNGFNCLKEGSPLRATGKINIDINGVKLKQLDLQAYIVVQDGRTYTAVSKIPTNIGPFLQLLYPITTMLNWLFAKPTGNGLNGFQITGGVLNHSAEILYKDTKDRVSLTQKYFGLDVFDQLKLEATIRGNVPQDHPDIKLTINDYQEQFNFVQKGVFRSSSSLPYIKIYPSGQEEQREIFLDQTVMFNESCTLTYNNNNISNNTTTGSVAEFGQRYLHSYYRVKTARNFINYEVRENILRFAATSKVSLLTENEDPCIEGRVKCVVNSSCVVEGDTFRCVCSPGFQTTYVSSGSDFGCLDVNECAEGKASCDANAICINEIGSYQCLCKPGYIGDGYSCAAERQESPCVQNPSLCNPLNSQCEDATDSRTCSCIPGYQKQYLDASRIGYICVDINECSLEVNNRNICGTNSYCVNREGSYECACRDGYSNDGNSCQPKNVACNILQNCSPNGECLYNETSSSYECRCLRGYYGNGYICQRYGGRKIVAKVCTSGVCVCPPRFIATDRYCIENDGSIIPAETNKMSCNVLNSMCHPHAQCLYNVTEQQYQCICNAGFEGNGIECTEMEVSCLRNDHCDAHATCEIDEIGKARCVCASHYHGDGIHCIYSGMCNSDGDCNQFEECYYNETTITYECKCKNGYILSENSTSCRLITKCPPCHENARCLSDNSTKDGHCECFPGYRGDGINNCERVPSPCNPTNISCSPYSTCVYNSSFNLHHCQCNQGYVGDGTTCKQMQTCLQYPQLCDRNARCIVRTYDNQSYCECNAGFVGDGLKCQEIEKPEGGFLFVNHGMSTLRIPYRENSTKGYPIQFQPNQIATGLAVDCVQGRVYWSDYIGQKIKSSNYKGKSIITLVSAGITAPEGLTLDWLNRKLYWSDSGKKIIESINVDGTERTIVIGSNLLNPRGIAIHPYKRKLFWSDWNRAQPKIEWSNLDGSERSVFLSGPDVQLPNSVAVDPSSDELCWADAGSKRIMCAAISTKKLRMVTANCSSPFGLAVSNDKYFWTDWTLGKVGYYDKYTSKTDSIQLPTVGSGTLYGIVAVSESCP